MRPKGPNTVSKFFQKKAFLAAVCRLRDSDAREGAQNNVNVRRTPFFSILYSCILFQLAGFRPEPFGGHCARSIWAHCGCDTGGLQCFRSFRSQPLFGVTGRLPPSSCLKS